MKKTSIVIAGGGFAGLSAAMYLDKTLARRAEAEVTMISRENFILFTPMLHEVASGDLYPGDIVNPVRRILRHVKFVEAEVQAIDLSARRIRCLSGIAKLKLEFEFDHLLLTLGSETNFFDLPGVSEWAVTMKSMFDAAMLRNRVLALVRRSNSAERFRGAPTVAHFCNGRRWFCGSRNHRRNKRLCAGNCALLSRLKRRTGSSRRRSSR